METMREPHDGNQEGKRFKKLDEVTKFKCCRQKQWHPGWQREKIVAVRKKVTRDPTKGSLGAVRQEEAGYYN